MQKFIEKKSKTKVKFDVENFKPARRHKTQSTHKKTDRQFMFNDGEDESSHMSNVNRSGMLLLSSQSLLR